MRVNFQRTQPTTTTASKYFANFTLLGRSRSSKTKLFHRISALPRSSNRLIWRPLVRKSYSGFTRNYASPLFHTTTILFRRNNLETRSVIENSLLPYLSSVGGLPTPNMLTSVNYPSLLTATSNPFLPTAQHPTTVPSDQLMLRGLGFTGGCSEVLSFPGFYLRSHQSCVSTQFLRSHRLQSWLQAIAHVLYFFLFLKIKYKGKSYKWFKRKSSVVLRFGYSHVAFVKIPNYFSSRKVGKMKLVFFGTALWDLREFLSSVVVWRPMNIYNGRGLRFARQLVFRKFGKVSAYR